MYFIGEVDNTQFVEDSQHSPLCTFNNRLVLWLLGVINIRGPGCVQHIDTCGTLRSYLSYFTFDITQFGVQTKMTMLGWLWSRFICEIHK